MSPAGSKEALGRSDGSRTTRGAVREAARRARRDWLPLLFVALFAWLDWVINRSLAFVLLAGGGVSGAIMFRAEIAERLGLVRWFKFVPARVASLLFATPGLLYFLIRGQGTSEAGLAVVLATLLALATIMFCGSRIDDRLAPFYAFRDRILPRMFRMLIALAVAILMSFLIIHGSLGDLPALFGGTTHSPQAPAGIQWRFFLATLLAAASAFLLVRERGQR
jgi:hypothetical protein